MPPIQITYTTIITVFTNLHLGITETEMAHYEPYMSLLIADRDIVSHFWPDIQHFPKRLFCNFVTLLSHPGGFALDETSHKLRISPFVHRCGKR